MGRLFLRLALSLPLVLFGIPSPGFSAVDVETSLSTEDVVAIAQEVIDQEFGTFADLSFEGRTVITDYLQSEMSEGEFANIRNAYFATIRQDMALELSFFENGLDYMDDRTLFNLMNEVIDGTDGKDEAIASLPEPAQIALEYAHKMDWIESENQVDPVADGSWWALITLNYYNGGVYAWTFQSGVHWSGNGSIVTWQDGSYATGWTARFGMYFYYSADLWRKDSGTGQYSEFAESRGHFAQCPNLIGCWQQWWPLIHHDIYANGAYSWSYSGV